MDRKLLIADDSITIQKVVELVLAEEGFEIKATSNGDEALTTISSFMPDVVLADIDMPVLNGYQLCEKMKSNPRTKQIPVILLAGAYEPVDEQLAKRVGAEDYIVKPFESQELISKINAVLTLGAVGEEALEEEAAEAVEVVDAEEDQWAMEDILSEPVTAEGLAEETPLEEEPLSEAFAEEAEAEVTPEEILPEEPFAEEGFVETEKVAPPQPMIQPAIPALSKDEVADIFRKSLDEKISAMLTLQLKDTVLSSLAPSVRETVEKIMWEVAPDLVERLVKEMLRETFASITKEIEKVIWETVPDLAERLISKEIEKIKSEL